MAETATADVAQDTTNGGSGSGGAPPPADAGPPPPPQFPPGDGGAPPHVAAATFAGLYDGPSGAASTNDQHSLPMDPAAEKAPGSVATGFANDANRPAPPTQSGSAPPSQPSNAGVVQNADGSTSSAQGAVASGASDVQGGSADVGAANPIAAESANEMKAGVGADGVPVARTGIAAAAKAAADRVAAANPAAPAEPAAAPATDAQKAAGAAIDKSYGDSGAAADKFNPNEKVGDLSKMSPEQRLAVINKMAQNDPANANGTATQCGSAALLAATIAGGGNAGVQELIAKMQKDNQSQNPAATPDMPAGDAETQAKLKALQEKLADPKSGGLTAGDLKTLQGTLQGDLQQQQQAMGDTNNGIGNKTMQNFINSDPKLAGMFFDKDGKQTMNLTNIDQTGNGTPGHWVVDMNSAKGGAPMTAQDGNKYNTVYDPWQRQNGGQVTTDAKNPALFKDYMQTNSGQQVNINNPNAS